MSETNAMPRCATCMRWAVKNWLHGDGYCRAIEDERPGCGLAAYLVVGHEGADLVVRADFGCVLHESAGGEA